ncbi:MAG: acyl dehydratase [Ilumatobacteraceae bacterium]|nr:acyl dehydratase [Ilumatobacteraceae bacterium]
MSAHRTLTLADVAVGDQLPELVIDMTATVVVAGAIATRDFMPVHHDRNYANAQGSPEIFMNILSDTAYCSRFVTDWAGPEAMVRSLKIRLGGPAYANTILTYTGSVTAVTALDAGEALVEVTLRAMNDYGEHVSGTLTVNLPAG